MPQLYTEGEGGWLRTTLAGESLVLSADQSDPIRPAGPDWDSSAALLVRLRIAVDGMESWVLLVPRGLSVRVNGIADRTGIHLLRDRDEVFIPRLGRVFFSAESLPEVVPFPEAEGKRSCGRCTQEIEPGSPAVRCQGCLSWFHQSETFDCWRYAPTCSRCPTPTDPAAGFRWTPEGL